jgi:hypothetical protein
MANRSSLARVSSADNVHIDVVDSPGLRKIKRLKHDHARGFTPEVFLQGSVVNNDFALARL